MTDAGPRPANDAPPDGPGALAALAHEARAGLALLAYPDRAWVLPDPLGERVANVLIVGAGQSGLGLAALLRREGVDGVALIDRAAAGHEGVWEDFARMPELRTPRELGGLDLGLPALSVQRWYVARFGQAAWDAIDRIPRTHWMDYLRWYRATLALPVENDVAVTDIRPARQAGGTAHSLLAVDTVSARGRCTRLARLVVLATGMDGGGAWRVPPAVAAALPAARVRHSSAAIDFARFAGQRVGVLGHGAAAFDNAVAALRAGARSVALCFRRARLPRVNPHRHIETAGFMTHFPLLDDATRWQVARHFRSVDQPPPRASFREALESPGFTLHAACGWDDIRWTGEDIAVGTPQGELRFDQAICATGTQLDLDARPELHTLAPVVARWSDRYLPPEGPDGSSLSAYPYLGEHYEFTPRDSGADWVTRVFAFNGASYVSHGSHSTSISGHRHALPRLARGLTRRLFLDQQDRLLTDLRHYGEAELDIPEDFEQQQARRAARVRTEAHA
jgi:cation diffusion facilitator CzcD-associated flavoprotein CzcO